MHCFIFLLAPFLSFEKTPRSEEHTSELQSRSDLVCRLLLEKKKKNLTLTNESQKGNCQQCNERKIYLYLYTPFTYRTTNARHHTLYMTWCNLPLRRRTVHHI